MENKVENKVEKDVNSVNPKPLDEVTEKSKDVEPKKEKSLKTTFIFLGVSLIFLGVSFFFFNKYVLEGDKIPIKKISKSKKMKIIDKVKVVTLYSANKTLESLVSSEIEIKDEDFSNEIKEIFLDLKDQNNYQVLGDDGNYISFMSPNINLLDSYLVGTNLYLNISIDPSKDIYDKKQELLILYSIINTYTSLDSVQRVKILVNSKEVEKLKWYSLKNFYTQNLDI